MSEHDDSYEPHHESSPTDHVLSELQLYGYRPFADEPDGRPLPEGNLIGRAFFIWMNWDCITFNGQCGRIGGSIQ